ncbi:hypothetical protein [uncultured Methanolobus sp.]|uniref:hypothetical protein n=1 Tax=uncultured Methanolobus sp. TaxID=218300 RepID=UPI0029C82C36|nr:hypothetical protein [uncultured Methanolobus sp.]
MDNPEWTKTKGFRLPQRTLDQLDFLVENGAGRNATEVVIIAIERLATQYETKAIALSSSEMLKAIMGSIDNKNAWSSEFLKEAVASLPEDIGRDRESILKMVRSFWKEEDVEMLKNMSDDDLKKLIATRIKIANDIMKNQQK